MRFIPTFCLRDGLILGKNLYNDSGALLLKKGFEIKGSYIEKIFELGFQGLYIDDYISRDIEIQNVISDELRLKSVSKIKNMFINIENNRPNDNNIKEIGNTVEDMVDELLGNRDLMVNMIDIKSFDDYTFFHSVNVAALSIIMGIALNLNKNELYKLGMGALLHDIGKVFIDKDLLNKEGKLTAKEFEIMKSHSLKGYRYMKNNYDIPIKSYIAALDHHEKYDGTGYPNNKAGKDISLFGRIIAIADVYDALTSDRPYRKACLPSDVIEYIMGGSDTHFDFELVNIFIQKVAPYPVGTCVKLNNGLVGIVVENFPDSCTRPKLKLLNKTRNEYTYINLSDNIKNKNLTIIDIVNI